MPRRSASSDRSITSSTSGLTLQAGARWNHDKKKLVADRPIDRRPAFLFGGPVDPPTHDEGEGQRSDLGRLARSRSSTIEVNVYARVAKGYRAPSIQGRILFDRDLTKADSENTMSYEAGIKTVLFDRRLRFNLAGYFFKTKDLQLSAVGGATNANLLLNADAVKGSGFEAELEARPATGLTLTAGISYNKTKIHDQRPGQSRSAARLARCSTPSRVVPTAYRSIPRRWCSSTATRFRRRRSGPSISRPATNIRSARASIYVFTDWYHRSKINFFLYESVEFSDDKLMEGGLRIGYRDRPVSILPGSSGTSRTTRAP